MTLLNVTRLSQKEVSSMTLEEENMLGHMMWIEGRKLIMKHTREFL